MWRSNLEARGRSGLAGARRRCLHRQLSRKSLQLLELGCRPRSRPTVTDLAPAIHPLPATRYPLDATRHPTRTEAAANVWVGQNLAI